MNKIRYGINVHHTELVHLLMSKKRFKENSIYKVYAIHFTVDQQSTIWNKDKLWSPAACAFNSSTASWLVVLYGQLGKFTVPRIPPFKVK